MAVPAVCAGDAKSTGGGFPKPSGVTTVIDRSEYQERLSGRFFLGSRAICFAPLANFADIYRPKFLRWE